MAQTPRERAQRTIAMELERTVEMYTAVYMHTSWRRIGAGSAVILERDSRAPTTAAGSWRRVGIRSAEGRMMRAPTKKAGMGSLASRTAARAWGAGAAEATVGAWVNGMPEAVHMIGVASSNMTKW